MEIKMGFLGKMIQGAIKTASLPLDVVKDVATLGGAITDEKSATIKKLKQIKEKGKEAYEALDD